MTRIFELDSSPILIVGLGNHGPEYAGTRHNIGFAVVNAVANTWLTGAFAETDLYDFTATVRFGRALVLARPRTYMNRSGLAVAALLERFETTPDRLLVVVDDFKLPLGRLRLRPAGSDGGQNGLRSIIETIGTQNFARLRVGLGEPPPDLDPADYVLSPFSVEETKRAQKTVARAAAAVIFAVRHPFERAMEQFNSIPDEPA